MTSLEDAQQQILNAVLPLPAGPLDLHHADGLFLAQPAVATVAAPAFDNSAMDGFAVLAADVASASPQTPVLLRILSELPAGQPPAHRIGPGQCIRLYTGSALPPGSDAVMMQEDTRFEPGSSQAACLCRVSPWENVRFKGEDFQAGSVLAKAGDRLSAPRRALLAAGGVHKPIVHPRPKIALLATGDELTELCRPLPPYSIFESNRVLLAQWLSDLGAEPVLYPLVPDTLADTAAALALAFKQCQAVITTGGASVGDLDFIKPALAAAGDPLVFWKVAIRPGKPFLFASPNGVPFFGLPGNPVSAAVTYQLLVKPAILKLMGAADCLPRTRLATLADPLQNPGDRRHFVRVIEDSDGRVRSAGPQASHRLTSLANATALADLPPNSSFPTGASVPILPLD